MYLQGLSATFLLTISGSLRLWVSGYYLVQFPGCSPTLSPPPTFFVFLLSDVFLDGRGPKAQLYTRCFQQLIFQSIKRRKEKCNFTVFYKYLHNYLVSCVCVCVLCIYIILGGIDFSLNNFSISCNTGTADNKFLQFLFIKECLSFSLKRSHPNLIQ